MNALILMSRMSDYMLNCLIRWREVSGVELHIVRMKVDTTEAPFEFGKDTGGTTLYNREDMSDEEIENLSKRLRPNLIICFGWFDPAYIATVRSRADGTVAVMTMDNQWRGTTRQILGAFYCRLFLVRIFDFVWVPGERQKRFARLLGFPRKKIREGLYVANDANFKPIYQSIQCPLKKRLVFVGRYVDLKGLRELWDAFMFYHASSKSQLELLCIGTGPLYKDRPNHPNIKHLGFVQPKDLSEILAGGGIFVLPSKYEPWGVVVHEFALSGFPLFLSNAVGAADSFLTAENGRLLSPNSRKSFIEAFTFVDNLDDATLKKMSEKSRSIGTKLSIDDWCEQANEFIRAARV